MFDNRTITFSLFKKTTDRRLKLLRDVLAENWNGKRVRLVLPTDPLHYYSGRLTVGKIGSPGSGRIAFSMIADPEMGAL